MKKLFKVNLLALIMLFAIGTAFAFNSSQLKTTEKWANDNGTWHYVEGQTQQPPLGGAGDYRCDQLVDPPICTAEFPMGNDPNLDPSGQTNEIYGEYVDIP